MTILYVEIPLQVCQFWPHCKLKSFKWISQNLPSCLVKFYSVVANFGHLVYRNSTFALSLLAFFTLKFFLCVAKWGHFVCCTFGLPLFAKSYVEIFFGLSVVAVSYSEILLARCHFWPFFLLKFYLCLPILAVMFVEIVFMVANIGPFVFWNSICALICFPFFKWKLYLCVALVGHFCMFILCLWEVQPSVAVSYAEIQFYFCVATVGHFVCWNSFCWLLILDILYV